MDKAPCPRRRTIEEGKDGMRGKTMIRVYLVSLALQQKKDW
jgi:hypothetical protein